MMLKILKTMMSIILKLILTIILFPIALFAVLVLSADDGFDIITNMWLKPKQTSAQWKELVEWFRKPKQKDEK